MNTTETNHRNYTNANSYHLTHLFYLRCLFIGALLITTAAAAFILNSTFQTGSLLFLVILLVIFNVHVWKDLKNHVEVSENKIFKHLIVDVAALTIALYYTGGASNPFITLFIFPLIISVTILPARYAWILALITILSYSFLMFQYQPLNFSHLEHEMVDNFNLHIVGMWMAFALSAALVSHFVVKMGSTIRTQDQLLVKAREDSLRDKQIIELGTLAASTAHELGTPLATMNLLVSEIRSELNDIPEQVKIDLDLLKLQIDRCKDALLNLSTSAGAINVSSGHVESILVFLNFILETWQLSRPNVRINVDWDDDGTFVKILHDRTLVQAIMNLLDNAADASPDNVEWVASWDDKRLMIEIRDRGLELSDEIKPQLGKPFNNNPAHGLGIGLFLSHAIIENFGGSVSLSKRAGGGMIAYIELPLLLEN